MTYQIKLHKKVEKFLDTQDDSFVMLFFEKTTLLAHNSSTPLLDIKPLLGNEKGCYMLRIGKYRFKYKIIDDQLIIYFYDAGSRGDIYR